MIFAFVLLCEGSASKLGSIVPLETNVLLGSPVELLCSINPEHKDASSNSWSSSHLAFFRPNGSLVPLSGEFVSVVNSTTIRFRKEHSTTEDSGDYYCNVKRTDGTPKNVGTAQVFVGTAPQPPQDVRCISYDLQTLSCSWTPPKNAVKTKYKIFFRLNSKKMLDRRFDCPSAKHARNTCVWEMGSEPPYIRRPLLLFGFEASNKLGTNVFERVYNFTNYQNFKPAPVGNLTVVPVAGTDT